MYYDSVRGGVEVVFFLPLFTRRQSFDSGYWRKQSLPRLRNLIDSEMSSLDSSVRRTLACLPPDPLLLLVLFCHESAQNSFKTESIAYLRLSYRFGPNDGWVIWRGGSHRLSGI